jgi:lysophospholipase L1-like esterase
VARVREDSLMSRFDQYGLRRFRARDGIVAVAVAVLLLVAFEGAAIRRAGERMDPGIGRQLVLAVGRPAGWVADRLPLERVANHATAWLSPDIRLASSGAFKPGTITGGNRVPPVTPAAFDPVAIGAPAPPRRRLHTLLVTGDSMSTPLDIDIARRLASSGVKVIRDPHLGAGLSKSFLVDWGELSTTQVRRDHPDATVVFIGANEGFPLPGPDRRQVGCCGPDWAALYADRARAMANTYRRNGAARVYWITLPTPRSAARQRIARVVNAAVAVAVEPWSAQIRLIDTVPVFTPTGYRDAMTVNGRPTIVRASDGIHLNDTGAELLAGIVLRRLGQDFTY